VLVLCINNVLTAPKPATVAAATAGIAAGYPSLIPAVIPDKLITACASAAALPAADSLPSISDTYQVKHLMPP
jgi:hypothetical protein